MITTREVKRRKAGKKKFNVITTRDLEPKEKEEIDPEKIANTQSIGTDVLGSGRGRRKKRK